MIFSRPESAPAIFTSDELGKILAACPAKLLPHIVISAFSGIRAAEIERREWKDILSNPGYFKYREIVPHLTVDQRVSIAEIVTRTGDFASVEAAARRAVRSGNP